MSDDELRDLYNNDYDTNLEFAEFCYNKGRADMKIDFIGMLEREFAIQNNPNGKFDETIILRKRFIEQLKEKK